MSYSLEQIHSAWIYTFDPMQLRQFVGNPEMGFKVAWSDRMVSAYTSLPLAALILRWTRKRAKPISIAMFLLLISPMAIDGITHMVSDLTGIGQGFRFTNAWLADVTNNALPLDFYRGDALGTFNSWMRIMTGILFGVGTMAFVYPYLIQAFEAQIPPSDLPIHQNGNTYDRDH